MVCHMSTCSALQPASRDISLSYKQRALDPTQGGLSTNNRAVPLRQAVKVSPLQGTLARLFAARGVSELIFYAVGHYGPSRQAAGATVGHSCACQLAQSSFPRHMQAPPPRPEWPTTLQKTI